MVFSDHHPARIHHTYYVYAQQNGKWGVMDWNEKVLVPFKYEHAHWNMRSDNWVAMNQNQKLVLNYLKILQGRSH